MSINRKEFSEEFKILNEKSDEYMFNVFDSNFIECKLDGNEVDYFKHYNSAILDQKFIVTCPLCCETKNQTNSKRVIRDLLYHCEIILDNENHVFCSCGKTCMMENGNVFRALGGELHCYRIGSDGSKIIEVINRNGKKIFDAIKSPIGNNNDAYHDCSYTIIKGNRTYNRCVTGGRKFICDTILVNYGYYVYSRGITLIVDNSTVVKKIFKKEYIFNTINNLGKKLSDGTNCLSFSAFESLNVITSTSSKSYHCFTEERKYEVTDENSYNYLENITLSKLK